MLINLDEAGQGKLRETCDTLGTEELLGQLTEECGELVQAAQKVRRARKGTTPVSLDDALVKLCEESADVLLCIEALVREGSIDETGVQFIGRYKNDRWHERTFGGGGDELAKAKQNASAVGSETGGETCCGAPT